MTKIKKVAFGIGLAIIVYLVIILGIKTFYKEPTYEDFGCNKFAMPVDIFYSCPDNISVAECRETINKKNQEDFSKADECYQKVNLLREEYYKNIFIIANIIGVILIVLSLYIKQINISVPLSFSGLFLIIYGFASGWNNTANQIKFFIGVIIALVILYSSFKLNKESRK